ncbi:CDP-glycerol glycerophosphotransferase family protein [Paenibacillus kobensis]|uniref:CDP-glycerol glycerophosphotransferase family protein n=1 Tax=Paenibacillus kobensis TaxID=59841 RepID=UPI000FD9A62A|nr:CDP-glycerol glycerophosphotransferase family protein [Paenibacillus kobensis]
MTELRLFQYSIEQDQLLMDIDLELLSDRELQVVLKNQLDGIEQTLPIQYVNNRGRMVLSLPLSEVNFAREGQQRLELLIVDGDGSKYEPIVTSLPHKEIYCTTSYRADYRSSITPYTSIMGALGLLCGNAVAAREVYSQTVDMKVTVQEITLAGTDMFFTIPTRNILDQTQIYVTLADPAEQNPIIVPHTIVHATQQQIKLHIDLNRDWSHSPRYDLFIQEFMGKKIRRHCMGIVDLEVGKDRNKYFEPIRIDHSLTLIPYVTGEGSLALFAGDVVAADRARGIAVHPIQVIYYDQVMDGEQGTLKLQLQDLPQIALEEDAALSFMLRLEGEERYRELDDSCVALDEQGMLSLSLDAIFAQGHYVDEQRWMLALSIRVVANSYEFYSEETVDVEPRTIEEAEAFAQASTDVEVGVDEASYGFRPSEQEQLLLYKFVKKLGNWRQEASERYKCPVRTTPGVHVIRYESEENELVFLIGDDAVYRKDVYTNVSSLTDIAGLEVNGTSITFRVEDSVLINETTRFLLRSRESKEEWRVPHTVVESAIIMIDVSKFIEQHLDQDSRWDAYIQTEYADIIEEGKLGLFSTPIATNEKRYYPAFVNISGSEDSNAGAIYLDANNGLSIVISPAEQLFNEVYKIVPKQVRIKNLEVNESIIRFDVKESDLVTKDTRFIFRNRVTQEEWIIPAQINGQLVEADITDFVEEHADVESRWDAYLQIEYAGIITEGKVGLEGKPIEPALKRYYPALSKSIAKSDEQNDQSDNDQSDDDVAINVVAPYLTLKNELAVVIRPIINLYNEKLKSSVSVERFQMKNGTVTLEAKVVLPECKEYSIDRMRLKLRNKAVVMEYDIPAVEKRGRKEEAIVSCSINLAQYNFIPLYWDLFVVVNIEGEEILVKLKNPTPEINNRVSSRIIDHEYRVDEKYMMYPYITLDKSVSFCYRERAAYESRVYKIKENTAYWVYRLFRKYFDKRNIWLGYEKNASTAQDNGYYFFEYCYENKKHDHYYFIIKKDAADYKDLRDKKNRIIKFMSFKYMVYMYAAKLLVSSESKGHSYDIRIKKGRLKKALDEKKFVFLQHGVIALKKIDKGVFKKTKHSGVDLFAVSSDYERDIIKNHFGYDQNEIIVTGLCRWDALQDKSSKENREILIMPTWRSWMDGIMEEEFVQSSYYHNYVSLLQSRTLKDLLEKNNIKAHFLLHPKFIEHVDKFREENSAIQIVQFGEVKVNELLMRSSMLITDYSSVAWEMYYQHKSTLFFQFDASKYNKLQGSYMDMDTELFGERAFTVEELIPHIELYIERDFKEQDKYTDMRNYYFKYIDKRNSERTLAAINRNVGKLYEEYGSNAARQRSLYNKLRESNMARAVWRKGTKNKLVKSLLVRIRDLVRR